MKIKINNKFFNHFSDLKVNFNLDTFGSTFSFKARFNPDNLEHQKIFRPLSYNEIQIFSNDNNLLLTGTIVNNSFSSSQNPELVSLSGYSKSGILQDVSIPLSVYPLEKNNQSLSQISSQMIKPFNIGQIIDPSANELSFNYEKVVANVSDTVAGFLSKLAAQRNVIIGHTTKGDLYYFKAFTNSKSVRAYTTKNVLSSSIRIDGQGFHRSISVLRQPSDTNDGASTVDSITNTIVLSDRKVIKTLSSGEDTDTSKAANNVLAAELKSLQVSIELPRIDYDLKCGQIVNFQNRELFIYKSQRFVVNTITYNEDSGSDTMSISLLLPEAFSGENPKNIFEI